MIGGVAHWPVSCRTRIPVARILRMTTQHICRKGLVIAVALVWVSSTAAADANSMTDYFGPREVSIGESMRADATGSLATNLNPAGVGLTRSVVFEGSYGYRPGDSASVIAASACDSTVPIAGCFYYRYFGAEPTLEGQPFDRRVHEFGMAAARALSQRFVVGINVRYFDYETNFMEEKDSSGFAADAGFIMRVMDNIQVAGVGYNVLAKESAQYPLGVGAGITMRPVSALALGLDGTWDLDTEAERIGRYGGGAEYFLQSADRQSGYPIRAGAVYDNTLESTYVTAGLGFTSIKMGLDVGARKQVDGGDELMIQAGLRVFGPQLP